MALSVKQKTVVRSASVCACSVSSLIFICLDVSVIYIQTNASCSSEGGRVDLEVLKCKHLAYPCEGSD